MKRSKKNKNTFAKNSLIVFTLTTFGSVINYLCQILMGKFFSISNYGVINTIFSLTVIISVIGTTASMVLSKTISENKKNSSSISLTILKIVNFVCLILFIFSMSVSPFLINILDWDYVVIVLAIISLITSIYPIVYQGIFGGMGKFVSLGLYTLIIPFIKVLCMFLIIIFKITGILEIHLILISIIFGNFLSYAIGYLITKKNLNTKKLEINSIKHIWNDYKDIFYANILTMFLMNVDILYLSFYYDSETIGLYSSVLIFGKMIYYFVTALVTVMLPLVSKNKNDTRYVDKMLYKTLTYTLILTILFLIPTNIFGKNILNIVFGTKYDPAIVYIKYASLISLSYSLNLIILNYLVGINKINIMKKTLIFGSIFTVIILFVINRYKYISLLTIFLINITIFIVNISFIKIKKLGGSK